MADQGRVAWWTANWERVLFSVLGTAFFAICFYLIGKGSVTEGAAVFGLGFLSFVYANVTRFKRFKGLGFEAELWEDKKQEAADLIERLRHVVSIYSREVILGKVKAGRWGNGADWASNWKLYDDLAKRHTELGQKIDLTDVKKVMDDYFLFDLAMPPIESLNQAMNTGRAAARAKLDAEFGSPVRDNAGYNARFAQYREIPGNIDDMFEISKHEDLGSFAINRWELVKLHLKKDFEIELDGDAEAFERLRALSAIYRARPVTVTEELVAWSRRESKRDGSG